jgi:hypothetical protein
MKRVNVKIIKNIQNNNVKKSFEFTLEATQGVQNLIYYS